jgi:hypothetical protein
MKVVTMQMTMVIIEKIKYYLIYMEDLLTYFKREVFIHGEKKELDEEHKHKIRFIYFFAILFILLLIGRIFNIL